VIRGEPGAHQRFLDRTQRVVDGCFAKLRARTPWLAKEEHDRAMNIVVTFRPRHPTKPIGGPRVSEREKKLEALLSRSSRDVFETNAETPHISDEKLASDLPPRWTPEELAHLARCAECRTIVAERAREDGGRDNLIRLDTFRARVVSVLAAAAALFIGVAFYLRDPNMRSKGTDTELRAELTMIATSANGERRDVESGGTLQLSDRIGFKCGNPEGEHKTLTVLGYDGRTVHWYYPERAGDPAHAIESTQAIGTRLPFDIQLEGDHQPGRLKIIGGFDVDPKSLAASIERGEIPKSAKVIEVEIK
jgi:hypothetical protein